MKKGSSSNDLQQSGIGGDDSVHDDVATKDNVDAQVTPTHTPSSLLASAEDSVAASFTFRRLFHFMDSPKNHISSSTKVCLFVYYTCLNPLTI